MPGQSTPVVYPSLRQLTDELKLVRRYGASHRDHPLHSYPALLAVARLVSTRGDDEAKVEDVLNRAVKRLGGSEAEAVAALLGLTDETRGRSAELRLGAAARILDHQAPKSFRTHYSNPLLLVTANQFFVLVAEWRLAQRVPVRDWPSILIAAGWGADTPQPDLYLPAHEVPSAEALDAPHDDTSLLAWPPAPRLRNIVTEFAKRMN